MRWKVLIPSPDEHQRRLPCRGQLFSAAKVSSSRPASTNLDKMHAKKSITVKSTFVSPAVLAYPLPIGASKGPQP
jgi:hypothetical protein